MADLEANGLEGALNILETRFLTSDESHRFLTDALMHNDFATYNSLITLGLSRPDDACIAALTCEREDLALEILDIAMHLPDCDVDTIFSVAEQFGMNEFISYMIAYYYNEPKTTLESASTAPLVI